MVSTSPSFPSPPGSGHSVSLGNDGQRQTVLRTTSCGGRQKPAVTTKASSAWPCTGGSLVAGLHIMQMDGDSGIQLD